MSVTEPMFPFLISFGFLFNVFDSGDFPQWLFMDNLAPFHGTGSSLNGFFLQWQFYLDSLVESKPEEKEWLGFMLSGFSSSGQSF